MGLTVPSASCGGAFPAGGDGSTERALPDASAASIERSDPSASAVSMLKAAGEAAGEIAGGHVVGVAGAIPDGLAVEPVDGRADPLQHVAYLYDGSIEGLLCCIFEAYARREVPEDIVPDQAYQPRFEQSSFFVQTDYDRALRVRRGVEREAGRRAFGAMVRAAAVDDPRSGMVVYRFVRYVMDKRSGRDRRRNVLNDLANPVVSDLMALEKRAANEEEKLRQFVRFSHLENGVWFARCCPNANVLPLVMRHFAERFNVQPFVIYDDNHRIAGVYDGNDWSLVSDSVINVPPRTAEDAFIEKLWQRFYDSLSIDARYNPELQRHFIPARLAHTLPELDDRPRSSLVRTRS